MPQYPKIGRLQLTESLTPREQIQEEMTKDQEPRLDGWGAREIGSPFKRSTRTTPNSVFLEGAVYVSPDNKRPGGKPLRSDTSSF